MTRTIKILAAERLYFDLTRRNRSGIDFWTIGDLIIRLKAIQMFEVIKKAQPSGQARVEIRLKANQMFEVIKKAQPSGQARVRIRLKTNQMFEVIKKAR